MNNSPTLVDSGMEESSLSARYSHQSFEPMSLLNQIQKQQQQQSSPSSVGSLKASPPIYHSPQVNSNKQKLSKFMNESGFSPQLKNRMITQSNSYSTLNKGNNTPTASMFKQTENSKDSPSNFQIDPKQSSRFNSIQTQSNPQLAQNNKKLKKDEGVFLPLIDPSQSKRVKNKLSLLEDKQSFFKEVNRFSRKSFCTQPATNEVLKTSGALPESPLISYLTPNSNRDNTFDSTPYTQLTSIKTINQTTNSLTLQIKKSPTLAPTSRPFLFQDSQKEFQSNIKLENEPKPSPFKVQSQTSTANSTTQLTYFNKLATPSKVQSIPEDTFSNPSLNNLSQLKGIDSALKRNTVIFKYPNTDDSSQQISTLPDIYSETNNSNTFTNTLQSISSKHQNQPQILKKESNELHSSQTFSSEDDGSQILISAINTNPIKKKSIINIRKLSQMESVDSKSFLSPQINQSNTLRRRQTSNIQLASMSSIISKLGSPSNKQEDLLQNQQNGKARKHDKIMSLFFGGLNQSESNGINNSTQQQAVKAQERAALMREFYYLLPDMKKYVTEEIEKDNSFKQDLFSFYMTQDLHEFSFHFGQFLDHLAEQRQLTEKTFPYKFPKKIFQKINNFMSNYISKQPQNSEQLLKLLEERVQKSIHIILPSTLLEALGGFCKVRNLCEQIAKMLYSSALSSHIIIYSEDKTVDKLEEFLLAALQSDFSKTKQMIEEYKKYSGIGFTGAEFYVMKQILFNYFANHSYYSDEVKYSFFELLESLRYQLTSEEGFTQQFLESKQEGLIKEFQSIWKQDPILSKLKESQKNSSLQFILVLFDYAFSQKNCYQLSKSFNDNFISAQLDILVVKSLHQMVKVATKRHSISQQLIQLNFNFLFKKLQWFISKENANYVQIIGDCKPISDQMLFIILNQKLNNESPTVQSPTRENNASSSDQDGSNKTPTKTKSQNKFKLLQQLQQQNQQQQKQSQPLSDISNFSQFLALFFNFYTTYHYSDIVCLFKSEKGSTEIFQFWAQIFGEALLEVRNVPISTVNEIKKFVSDLFEFQKNNQQQQ